MQLVFQILLLVQVLASSQLSLADCNRVVKISPDNPPPLLSETGVFEDLIDLKICSSALKYEVNLPFWSDGALKERWVILPKDQKIQFVPDDPWKFPKGTILIKHFELPSNSSKNIRIETRLLMNLAEDDWYGYSYQWQDDQKDAVLLDDSATKEYFVAAPHEPGGTRKQVWQFPSQRACLECHNSWSSYVLGIRTEQLNLVAVGKQPNQKQTNQLNAWNEMNLFSKKIEEASHFTKYVSLADKTQSLEKRAKSYLASNCVQCHQPDSPVRSNIDFRLKTPVEFMNLIGRKPNAGDMDMPGALLIQPGKKESSILWLRLMSTTTMRMPPLGSNVADREGIDLIGTWIDSLGSSHFLEEPHEISFKNLFSTFGQLGDVFRNRFRENASGL